MAAGDKRKITPREGLSSNKLFVLSGALSQALQDHAFERCRHFFLFLTAIRTLEFLNNEVQGRPKIAARAGFTTKATEQIDQGWLRGGATYHVFGADDEDVVKLPSTQFKDVDAAHFCNLGIEPGFVSRLDLSNDLVMGQFAELKVYAGNTRWLPKLVNIGPDRRIDVLHGTLAAEFLDDGEAIVSRGRIPTYMARARADLQEYADEKVADKRRGVAACTRCYLDSYAQPRFADRIFNQLSGGTIGWIEAVRLADVQKMRARRVLVAYT
jgi:hypothetical protein